MGETLNAVSSLDIEQEFKLVQAKKIELQTHQATKEEEKVALKELGLQRFYKIFCYLFNTNYNKV